MMQGLRMQLRIAGGVTVMRATMIGLTAIIAVIGLTPAQAASISVFNSGPPTGVVTSLTPPGASLTSTAPTSTGVTSIGTDPWGMSSTNIWMAVGSTSGGCCGSSTTATFTFGTPENVFDLLWGSPNT